MSLGLFLLFNNDCKIILHNQTNMKDPNTNDRKFVHLLLFGQNSNAEELSLTPDLRVRVLQRLGGEKSCCKWIEVE